ncbi:MAG: hypothetical protein ACI8S6_004649 [Myxococcota bacterium]|jgi:hypothetical protein
MSSCITIVDDFLFEDDLDHIRAVTRPQRGKLDVYGGLQEADFIRPLLRSAEANFEAVYGLELQQVLLRFEGNTGLLHHDLNHRPDRLLSLLYYIDEPDRGGEIIFPFFDASGAPTSSNITKTCTTLWASGQLYSKDPALEQQLLAERSKLLTVRARSNRAVLIRSDDPAAWHFVCPVEAGQRSCLVVFYQERSAQGSASPATIPQ